MTIPFTVEQFYAVFREYNEAVWPLQWLLLSLALVAFALVFINRRASGVAISAILASFWTWMALAYHVAFFARINPLAYAFAAISIAGALVFLWQGVFRDRLQFGFLRGMRSAVGSVLVAFALVVYPAWSWSAGHGYPEMPTFGLPCPTTLFTIGMLAFLLPPFPRSLFVIPILWSLVGGQAALFLHVPQDFGLFVAAAVGIILMSSSRSPSNGRLADAAEPRPSATME